MAVVQSYAADHILLEVMAVVAMIVAYLSCAPPNVYCVENVVSVPPSSWRVTRDDMMTIFKTQSSFEESSVEFMRRLVEKGGTGESTHLSPSWTNSKDGQTAHKDSIEGAREEAKQILFPIVQELLQKTKLKPTQIDILIINCSIFVPTPSLCAMVCSEFGLREDVLTYNLGGMGCSANPISVDLAKRLLQNMPGSRALVISTEIMTHNLYTGNSKGFLLQNSLFRCGGCALLFSSRRQDFFQAKYKLLHTVRVQVSDEISYGCVWCGEDEKGIKGVALSKDLVTIAGKAMKKNLTRLAPHVLPIREQLKVPLTQAAIMLISKWKKMNLPLADMMTVPKGAMPSFSKGIDHFCIHAGGRAVIEGVQKSLCLRDEQMAPSFTALKEFGNTSSSSIWYEMDFVERFGGLRRGDRIMQIAFGSGFKCNSAVWVAMRVDQSKKGVPLKKD